MEVDQLLEGGFAGVGAAVLGAVGEGRREGAAAEGDQGSRPATQLPTSFLLASHRLLS